MGLHVFHGFVDCLGVGVLDGLNLLGSFNGFSDVLDGLLGNSIRKLINGAGFLFVGISGTAAQYQDEQHKHAISGHVIP